MLQEINCNALRVGLDLMAQIALIFIIPNVHGLLLDALPLALAVSSGD